MIRAMLGIAAALVVMAAVIFLATEFPDEIWSPVVVIFACLAGGFAGILVGRTQCSSWVAVGLLFASAILYAFYMGYAVNEEPDWPYFIGIPAAMLVACWCGTMLARKTLPVADEEALEDLRSAFDWGYRAARRPYGTGVSR